ncbi:MAG: hypothetical protein JST67_02505 [Bacteroidetes bacterium]|nr:hypothetical protein [Bacteroidota bacterium]
MLRIDFVHGSVKDTLGTTLLQIPQISNNYYIVSSNAFLQKRGEFYGSSSYFVFYNLNYAIDKHVSVGISTSFYAVPVMLHIKSNFKIGNNMYLGLDGMGGSGSWLNPKSYGGLGLAKLTYGTIHTNFTISAGYGNIEYYSRASRRRGGGFGSYRPSKHRDYNSFLVAAAFTCPISTRFAFTAEAFAAPLSGIYTLAPALRTTRKPNLSFVFGIEGILTISPTSGLAKVIGFPYLGASFRIK